MYIGGSVRIWDPRQIGQLRLVYHHWVSVGDFKEKIGNSQGDEKANIYQQILSRASVTMRLC